jgi:hypothetical protein
MTSISSSLPSNKPAGAEDPWSKTVSDLEKSNMINIIPYEVHLDYDYWDYRKSAQIFDSTHANPFRRDCQCCSSSD